MSTEANKDLVRRFYEEAWGHGRLDAAGMRQVTQDFRAAFPDLSFTVGAAPE